MYLLLKEIDMTDCAIQVERMMLGKCNPAEVLDILRHSHKVGWQSGHSTAIDHCNRALLGLPEGAEGRNDIQSQIKPD